MLSTAARTRSARGRRGYRFRSPGSSHWAIALATSESRRSSCSGARRTIAFGPAGLGGAAERGCALPRTQSPAVDRLGQAQTRWSSHARVRSPRGTVCPGAEVSSVVIAVPSTAPNSCKQKRAAAWMTRPKSLSGMSTRHHVRGGHSRGCSMRASLTRTGKSSASTIELAALSARRTAVGRGGRAAPRSRGPSGLA